jgi:hypothetical protein
MNCHLCHIIKASRWVVEEAPEGSALKPRWIGLFENLIKTFRKNAKCTIRKQLLLEDNSIKSAVNNRKFPEGGLQQLQEQVAKEYGMLTKLLSVPIRHLTEGTYNYFMQCLYVCMYVTSPQGRLLGKV